MKIKGVKPNSNDKHKLINLSGKKKSSTAGSLVLNSVVEMFQIAEGI